MCAVGGRSLVSEDHQQRESTAVHQTLHYQHCVQHTEQLHLVLRLEGQVSLLQSWQVCWLSLWRTGGCWSWKLLFCLGLHCSPLVLDVAVVFICAVLLLIEQQDGDGASRLSELQLLSLSKGQILQRAVLILSFPGELDQRRRHG